MPVKLGLSKTLAYSQVYLPLVSRLCVITS